MSDYSGLQMSAASSTSGGAARDDFEVSSDSLSHLTSVSQRMEETAEGREGEEEEEEEDDDVEEPKLKYERLTSPDLRSSVLGEDAVSCVAVHPRLMALGTHWGRWESGGEDKDGSAGKADDTFWYILFPRCYSLDALGNRIFGQDQDRLTTHSVTVSQVKH